MEAKEKYFEYFGKFRAALMGEQTANDIIGLMEEYASDKVAESNEWVRIEAERLEWSLKTFTEATPISSLRKCESEIKEIEQDILMNQKNPEEYADAMMCLLDSAGRQGITLQDIFQFYVDKTAINKARTWRKNPDNSYSHVKPTAQD